MNPSVGVYIKYLWNVPRFFVRTYSIRARRAVMYVPGMDERKITKLANLGVDTAVLDLEDGVAVNQKAAAREMIPKALHSSKFMEQTERVVRINSISSGLTALDLEAVLTGPSLPDALFLPKVEDIGDIEKLAEMVLRLRDRTRVNLEKPFPLFILIESPLALLNLQKICHWSRDPTSTQSISLAVVVFGSDDYLATLGGTRTESASEILYARQHLVTVAKAYNLQAIDLVHIDFKNLSSLELQAAEGARMGFNGKQVIHPSQVPVVQKAFTPSDEQLKWAVDLIKAFEEHQASGKGAFSFRDHMIDKPLLLQAENIVRLSNLQPK